jgi:hypothetical protein
LAIDRYIGMRNSCESSAHCHRSSMGICGVKTWVKTFIQIHGQRGGVGHNIYG